MASLRSALDKMYINEGGWTIDQGGKTYKGISRKGWPGWAGWVVIDKFFAAGGRIKKEGVIPGTLGQQLEVMCDAFYTKNYWAPIKGDKIINQDVANFLFDFFIPSNKAIAIINGICGNKGASVLTDDTIAKINKSPQVYYPIIKKARREYFIYLSTLNKQNAQSLAGWLNRLKKFPDAVAAPLASLVPLAAAVPLAGTTAIIGIASIFF